MRFVCLGPCTAPSVCSGDKLGRFCWWAVCARTLASTASLCLAWEAHLAASKSPGR